MPPALRPAAPGKDYEGPRRVPVDRRTYKGSLARPYRLRPILGSAVFSMTKVDGQKMADKRHAENKEKQNQIKMAGHDCSEPDPVETEPDYTCKLLKVVKMDWQPHGGQRLRLIFRRQEISKIYI